jgi:hypothetical protein
MAVADDVRSERGLLVRLRVPLLFAAACLIGFLLQFGAGVPGTPVWAGVLAAEAAVFLADRYLARRPRTEVPAEALPPDPSRRWTAELEWHERGAGACFRAVARSETDVATVSRSRTFGWPPEGPDAVQQVTRAAGELETALLAAGWGPLPGGDAWYAKRFAWPVAAPEEAPVPAAPEPPATGARTWPAEARALPRCEVRWSEGYRRSWFEVVVFTPGRRRSQVLASSDPFKWMLAAPPDPGDHDHLRAMVALCAALEEDGWEEIAPGPKWYSRRFVWRHPTPPPDRLGAESARA